MTSRSIHLFSLLLALSTLALVGLGGLVTSHGVGMAVPDWPNSYGYNMFFFPVSQWVGGIFYEHTHRLLASTVGFLTSILALWLYGTKARPFMRWLGVILVSGSAVAIAAAPRRWADALVLALVGSVLAAASFVWPRCEPAPAWLRRLGLAAFFGVVLQGVLGGLRVVWLKDQIGIFHATLAQLFFALTCCLALFTSPWWQKRYFTAGPRAVPARSAPEVTVPFRPSTLDSGLRTLDSGLRTFLITATLLILAQLILGATMRHQHAGLAIPDFPLAYGKLWPATDPASVAHYNQQRLEVTDANPITAFQITLQMLHRLLAGLILLAVLFCAWLTHRRAVARHFRFFTLGWLGLILLQATLGAATIWSNKAADIATLHVVVGALSLVTGALLTTISIRDAAVSAVNSRAPAPVTKPEGLGQPDASIRLHPI